jgi:DDE superfamily endonuclease
MLGVLDFGANALTQHVTSSSIRGAAVVEFLEQITRLGDEGLTAVVLDNAAIHYVIDPEVHEYWLREHRMQLFYLPPYGPELNRIEIVLKQEGTQSDAFHVVADRNRVRSLFRC